MGAGALTLITSENATLEYSSDGVAYRAVPFVGDIGASGGEAPENDVVTFSKIGKVVGHPRVPSLSVTVPSYVPNHSSWQTIHDALINRTPLTWRITTRESRFYEASGAGNTVAIADSGLLSFLGQAPDFTGGEFGEGMVLVLGDDLVGAEAANTATVEYVYRATAGNAAPATPSGGAATDDYVSADWSAAAIEPTAALPYVWRSTRTQTGGAWTADDFAAAELFASKVVKHTIDTIDEAGTVTVYPTPAVAVPATEGYEVVNPSLRLGPFIGNVRSAGNFELPAEGQLSTTLEVTPRSQLPKWVIV